MKDLPLSAIGAATDRPISVAIVAMGGQGGGVLTAWIVDLAESQGWVAQSTSVPGVAQRTGATIYYVEMMRPGPNGEQPVLAQMPTPGDVDVVLAAEYMEAGRSILRGLVTPERTTLIASNHRALAINEKIAPGGGIADSGAVNEAIRVVAKRQIIFDMNALATANGSVISSALFGGLAASDALPFPRETFIEVIRAGGKGIEASQRAFDAAFVQANAKTPEITEKNDTKPVLPIALKDPLANALLQRIRAELPTEAQDLAYLGLRKVVDFQDAAYGSEYLDLLRDLHVLDAQSGGTSHHWNFTAQAAKYLANAMAYDDLMRVADLKTRAARRHRIEGEMGLTPAQILHTTEFMHPRMDEVAATLPAALAERLIARTALFNWLDRRINKGRRVKTYSLRWFLMLSLLARWKAKRRITLRHSIEVAHRDAWLNTARQILPQNYALAVEILKFRRLIKGYSDTHARGQSKFDKAMATARTIAHRDDAADWAQLMLSAAIKDASGAALDGTIKTIESFA